MRSFKIFAAGALCLAFSAMSFAQTNTETFKVNGNCGMCKTSIEKAAKAAGAQKAEWNKETKDLTVTYVSASTNTEKIQQKIAEVGYDNVGFTATADAYDKLHGCCKYDRTAMTTKKACCASGCEMKDGKCDMTNCKEKDCCKDEVACKEKGCCGGDHKMANADNKMDCCKDGKCSKEGHKGGDCCAK